MLNFYIAGFSSVSCLAQSVDAPVLLSKILKTFRSTHQHFAASNFLFILIFFSCVQIIFGRDRLPLQICM